jgi:hypothetical protein
MDAPTFASTVNHHSANPATPAMHEGQAGSSKSAGETSRGGSLESSMPLQLALVFLALTINPGSLTVSREVYSTTFTAAILEVITFEILELGDGPISFEALKRKVHPLVNKEVTRITRNNEKLRSRGQHILPEREHAADYQDWLGHFVSPASHVRPAWLTYQAQQFEDIDEGCIAIDGEYDPTCPLTRSHGAAGPR